MFVLPPLAEASLTELMQVVQVNYALHLDDDDRMSERKSHWFVYEKECDAMVCTLEKLNA